MTIVNRKVVLSRRPGGIPQVDDFEVVDEEIGELGDGEILIKVEHLGIDAFITTTLDYDGHHGQSELEQPVMALGTGRVVESRYDGLEEGDAVFGGMGAQQYAKKNGSDFTKLDTSIAEARAYLGVLGMTTGLTAYAGMVLVGEVREGDTVAVSGAAGAVGTVACQLAKIKGARVIGIAGGAEKCAFLEEIGCAGAIDYKNENVGERLKELAPDGLNVFFDNVGGAILDSALDSITTGARVVICGAISQYANMAAVQGPSLYLRLAERNSSMRGFTVDHYAAQFPTMVGELAAWSADGLIKLPEQIESGIENFPRALTLLYSGGHLGKLIVEP